MSQFNKPANIKTNNFEGGLAFINDSKLEIASIVLNSYFNVQEFYQNQQERINSIAKLIKNNESEFIAKLAIYSRSNANLRSVSHALIILLAENNDASGNLRKMVYKSVQRVDDMTEIVALWNSRHPQTMLPNAIRRAFRDILNEKKFDAYQLKKYEQKRAKVKLKDIIRIAKPSQHIDLYKKVLENSLDSISTIHADISKEKSAKQLFEDLYEKNKLGYLEVLKMSTKIFQDGVTKELFEKYSSYILDEKRILNSRVLPFRFYQTYCALLENESISQKSSFTIRNESIYTKYLNSSDTSYLQDSGNWKIAFKVLLQKAFFLSTKVDNFVEKDEKIAVMVDDSGSMSSEALGLSLFEHALLLTSSIAYSIKSENFKLYFWSDRCQEVKFDKYNPFEFIADTQANAGATYMNKPFEILLKDKIRVDKAIILTDCQMYGYGKQDDDFRIYVDRYKQEVNPDIKVLFWDLAGYAQGTPIKLSHNILEANGISNKMLQLLPKLWNDKQALIQEIEKVTL